MLWTCGTTSRTYVTQSWTDAVLSTSSQTSLQFLTSNDIVPWLSSLKTWIGNTRFKGGLWGECPTTISILTVDSLCISNNTHWIIYVKEISTPNTTKCSRAPSIYFNHIHERCLDGREKRLWRQRAYKEMVNQVCCAIRIMGLLKIIN